MRRTIGGRGEVHQLIVYLHRRQKQQSVISNYHICSCKEVDTTNNNNITTQNNYIYVMESSGVSAAPLMTPTKEVPKDNKNDSKTASEHELHFFDPHAVLRTVSRDVAFGYLILLTGGNFEYKAPTLPENQSADQQQQQQENEYEATYPRLDEETSQLAYAAIVDGNVLHAVFGLKAAANGKANIILNDKPKSSILCCIPSSTMDALEFILPQSTKNKAKMQQLVEALQEVRDLYHESLEVPEDTSSDFTLHMEVIQAYVKCFTAIASYHDQILLEKLNGKDSLLDSLELFKSKKKKQKDKKLEELQKATLNEIESGFNGLREKIWEKLEQTTGETAAISITSG